MHDIAIYMPGAGASYDVAGPSAGGAELQTVLLAKGLAARGVRVAHIVLPVAEPVARQDSMPTVIERHAYQGDLRVVGKAAEARHIWRGMSAADAKVYVFRAGGPQLFVGMLFSRMHGRKTVFSAANDLDFDFDRPDRSQLQLRPYRAAVRGADAIVVQTGPQLELARRALPKRCEPVLIPSFVEPAEPASEEPEAFIWIGRLAAYKRPLEYVRLAAALPDIRFRMVYLEDMETPADTPRALEAAARNLQNLELLGRLPRNEVLALIKRSFAVISTSSFEGMPNVFLEAWARGVPVASLEWDPAGEIERRGIGCVAGGSPERLAEIVRSLSQDPVLVSRIGAKARAYVREVHDPVAVASRWADLLGEILV